MGSVPPLLSFLLMIAAGWVHRHQLIVIEFLQAENRLLKDRLRGKRIRFTDAERALLARKAKAVGRSAGTGEIVSSDTLLRLPSDTTCARISSPNVCRAASPRRASSAALPPPGCAG